MAPRESVPVKAAPSKEDARKALDPNKIREAIPKEAFVKSVVKSMFYFFFDYAIIFGSMYCMNRFIASGQYDALPFYQQALLSLVYWNVLGFFMWCIFVVGHDCGHGTFSNYEWFNDIIGHICHASILVPFYPWQLSHRRHHMFHNHVDKDYSHPWYLPERLLREDEGLARLMDKYSFIRVIFPFVGWPIYIFLGMPDGNHMIPFAGQRLWKESEETQSKESIKCIVSAISVILAAAGSYYYFDQSFSKMAYNHLIPVIFFGWWLVSVTYLQHHEEDTLVYDDKSWNFVDSAFETVDRKFGYGIDTLHHHITDGHVAHHLFFTKIPHYNLPIATKAIQEYLARNGLDFLYKYEITTDFVYRTHKNFVKFGFHAHKAPDDFDPVDAKAKADLKAKKRV